MSWQRSGMSLSRSNFGAADLIGAKAPIFFLRNCNICKYFGYYVFGVLYYKCSDFATNRRFLMVDKSVDTPPKAGIDRSVELTLQDRLHVQKGMQLYLKSLERSRGNEVPGSDVYRFRTTDMEIVRAVLNRVA